MLVPAYLHLGAGDGDECPGGEESEAAEQAEGSVLTIHNATVLQTWKAVYAQGVDDIAREASY